MAVLLRGCQPFLQQLRSQLRTGNVCAGRLYATGEGAAAAAPGADGAEDDPVMAAFHLQQSAYRQIIEGMQNIDVPLAGDSAAVHKYADEVEALKKKAGYPDPQEIIEAQLAQTMAQADSYSNFLKLATEGKDLGDHQDLINDMISAAVKAEEESGDDLHEDNQQGLSLYKKSLQDIMAKHGVQSPDKLRQEAIYGMYESHLNELKETVIEATETAKRRDHLEHVNVDLAAIKPRWEAA